MSILGCDDVCEIDLAVSVKDENIPDTGFVIGSQEKLTVSFTVTNR